MCKCDSRILYLKIFFVYFLKKQVAVDIYGTFSRATKQSNFYKIFPAVLKTLSNTIPKPEPIVKMKNQCNNIILSIRICSLINKISIKNVKRL